jgi:hypothetical protein
MQAGDFRILVVQLKQLRPFRGHLPRLVQVLRHSAFSRLVKQVHIDEAHTIYTAGIPLYGQPAFHPAWGHLGELCLWLPKKHSLSGAFRDPPSSYHRLHHRQASPSVGLHINPPHVESTKHHIQWVKKLSQCLAVLKRLTCRNTSKLHYNLKVIYNILGHLGFQTSPISCDLG